MFITCQQPILNLWILIFFTKKIWWVTFYIYIIKTKKQRNKLILWGEIRIRIFRIGYWHLMNKILNDIISLFSSWARNFQTWNYTKQFGRKFEKSSKTSQTAVEVNRSQGNSAIVHTWYLGNPQIKICKIKNWRVLDPGEEFLLFSWPFQLKKFPMYLRLKFSLLWSP